MRTLQRLTPALLLLLALAVTFGLIGVEVNYLASYDPDMPQTVAGQCNG